MRLAGATDLDLPARATEGSAGFDLRARTTEMFSEFPDVASTAGGGRLRDQLWVTISLGPDQDLDVEDGPGQTTGFVGGSSLAIIQPYDPTNGTLSDGDIVRFRE